MEVPNYGPMTNRTVTGIPGTGILGTAAATLMTVPLNPCSKTVPYYSNSTHSNTQWWPTPENKTLNEILDEYQKDMKNLKDENEALKTKVDLLEIQFKFMANKFAAVEKLMESKKGLDKDL